ncbi:hypothetical protein DEO72_LG2g974 [Vigna unguiculata]|uniref:Uncharacterized protein n=1 Tax=Vigna unguiculata TaxID=3917 RepID=A0A4D6KT17_VIGUN|nr:hypothetical protein DEO72_LG2g974 [Vigna unguiculata]
MVAVSPLTVCGTRIETNQDAWLENTCPSSSRSHSLTTTRMSPPLSSSDSLLPPSLSAALKTPHSLCSTTKNLTDDDDEDDGRWRCTPEFAEEYILGEKFIVDVDANAEEYERNRNRQPATVAPLVTS